MVEIHNYLEAASALTASIINAPVEGRFRKVALAALDYLCKTDGGCKLNFEQKRILGIILTLGKDINDYYDIGFLDSGKYINLRREFKRLLPQKNIDFRKYLKDLSGLEKGRPVPSQIAQDIDQRFLAIKNYREGVNKLYLAFALSVALDKPLNSYYECSESLSQHERDTFEGFFNASMAMQVVDDLVGSPGDLKADRPSFYTALCSPAEIVNQVPQMDEKTRQKMDQAFFYYFNQAGSLSLEILKPVLTAVKLTKDLYPKLTQLTRKYSFLGNIAGVDILSERDRNNL